MKRRSPLPHGQLRRALLGLLLWSVLWPVIVLAADHAPTAKTGEEWTASADGAYLIQRSARLVWSRCLVGTRWNGRDCVGQPVWADLPQAQAVARQRAQTDGLPWRLPHQRELLQLARLASSPDQAWLPDNSQGWVWSGSVPITLREINPYTYENIVNGNSGPSQMQMKVLHGWVVNTATGQARDDVLRRTPMYVHLVRSLD